MNWKKRLEEFVKLYQAKMKEASALADDPNFDPSAVKANLDEIKRLKEQIEAAKGMLEAEGFVMEAGTLPYPTPKDGEVDGDPVATKALRLRMSKGGRVTAFKSEEDGSYPAKMKAHDFGMWFLATLGRPSAVKYCAAKQIGIVKSHSEGDNDAGGFLVPEQFLSDIINLREMYGVIRRYARVIPMASDRTTRPRRVGGLTVYYPGEGGSLTESQKQWDMVGLTAKKATVLTKISSELNEDSVIDLGNDLAEEIAYAYSVHEDQAAFIGDGTSTYGSIRGISQKFLALSNTIANIAGLVVGAGNAYSELTKANFNSVVAKLPQYADTPNARWFMHRSFFYEVCMGLGDAAGGQTQQERVDGMRTPMWCGYPVAFTQAMPKTEANSQICALLGDMRLACDLGDRRSMTIMMSEHNDFETDQIAIRATMRWDFNAHDLGNASSTAGSRVPGPLVGLITAAS